MRNKLFPAAVVAAMVSLGACNSVGGNSQSAPVQTNTDAGSANAPQPGSETPVPATPSGTMAPAGTAAGPAATGANAPTGTGSAIAPPDSTGGAPVNNAGPTGAGPGSGGPGSGSAAGAPPKPPANVPARRP